VLTAVLVIRTIMMNTPLVIMTITVLIMIMTIDIDIINDVIINIKMTNNMFIPFITQIMIMVMIIIILRVTAVITLI